MKQRYLIVSLLFAVVTTNAQVNFITHDTPSFTSLPKRETRAVWLTTIGGLDWPHSYAQSSLSKKKQQEELCAILDKLRHAGINTILFQTRIRGTVVYPSAYEPWDGCLTGFNGRSPDYDVLKFATDECHRRGMELHAWIVTIPVGKWNGFGCRQMRKYHPNMVKRIAQEGYLSPECAETADYLSKICAEITRLYDIDGIHLDYIRYPENWKLTISKERARRNITDIVRKISLAVKTLKPWVKMSCAPIGKRDDLSRYDSRGWNAYEKVCQDAQEWLRSGLMDEIFPMMYFKDNNFYPFAIDWKERSEGRLVSSGLGIYFLSPKERNWSLGDITRELQFTRQFGLGHAFYRSKFLTDNTKGIYRYVADEFNASPALTPPMSWLKKTPPCAPTDLKIDSVSSSLTWQEAANNNDSPYLTYNIYAGKTPPIDISDSRNLMLCGVRGGCVKIPLDCGLRYAVTSMDRYGNESEAVQTHGGRVTRNETAGEGMLECIDGKVKIPTGESYDDIEYVAVESPQGVIITLKRPFGEQVDVSSVPNGVYLLRSVNKRGGGRKLGFFCKMR